MDTVTEGLRLLADAELISHGQRGFGTYHDLVAETVREALAPVEKARLHKLLAAALASDSTDSTGSTGTTVSGHGTSPEQAIVQRRRSLMPRARGTSLTASPTGRPSNWPRRVSRWTPVARFARSSWRCAR
ncbi:MAG: hypothetical protein GEU86_21780 [Actinophytocola sp.]|nr:hypothetical protein [Actinophytocola sp.]